MTVPDLARLIHADRRRQMRAALTAARFAAIADRLTRRACGYDPAGFRAWLEREGARQ